jgi:NADH-quinone oxidoreductase subunit N
VFGSWSPVALEVLAVLGAALVLVVDLLAPEGRKAVVGRVSLGVAAALAVISWACFDAGDVLVTMFGTAGEPREVPGPAPSMFAGTLVLDPMAIFLKRVFATGGVLAIVVARVYEDRLPRGVGEFHFLLLTALAGMFLVSGVADFMSLFVCLEVVTLSFFVLAAFRRDRASSTEAGVKLLVVGSVAAAFVLLGAAFIYGATGSVRFDALRGHLAALQGGLPGRDLVLGLLLVFLGLAFKIGMVPLQVWVPDVYQGAPTPVTAFLAVGSKAAGFALVLRVAEAASSDGTKPALQLLFGAAAFATLFYGNLAAIPQTDMKRLMGYSSIGHCGYLLLGLAALGPSIHFRPEVAADGAAAILVYLMAYALTTMLAFLVIVIFSGYAGGHSLDEYDGLSKRSPALAGGLTVALLSLAGVPPLAGFFGKFMLLRSIAGNREAGFWLLAAACVNVVIGLYYYLCVVKRMYMHAPRDPSPLFVPARAKALLYALIAVLVILGVAQGPLVEAATDAARAAYGIR